MKRQKWAKVRDLTLIANTVVFSFVFFQNLMLSFSSSILENLLFAIAIVLLIGGADYIANWFFKWVSKGNCYEWQIVAQIIMFICIVIGVTIF
ncbi:MAG: hypothetical protein HOE11_02185 [Candidatus Diapherotrites archaeon]|jgi:hypothetical protein|nr:hypothetical protein [Candidatus Diapherotrites archaeon]